MVHWIHEHSDADEIEELADKYGWSVTISDSDKGPIEFTHEDGSEASFVRSRNTGTYAIEYEPSDEANAGVKLNKGDYYHASIYDPGIGQQYHSYEKDKKPIEYALEEIENVLKQHEKKN